MSRNRPHAGVTLADESQLHRVQEELVLIEEEQELDPLPEDELTNKFVEAMRPLK